MRIDLPGCSFKYCRYNFDCNCTAKDGYRDRCEFRRYHEAECEDRLFVLPPPVTASDIEAIKDIGRIVRNLDDMNKISNT